MKRLSILIPNELHKEFKKIVADKETNMSEIIKDFIEKFIRDTKNEGNGNEEKNLTSSMFGSIKDTKGR